MTVSEEFLICQSFTFVLKLIFGKTFYWSKEFRSNKEKLRGWCVSDLHP